jgi:putative membrane protein
MFKSGLITRILASFIGFYLATWIFEGFAVTQWTSALGAAALLVLVNVTVGSILRLLSLPVIIITVGLFTFVINAVSLLIVDYFVEGIAFASFWPALGTAVIMAIANAILLRK